jgi:type IV pilus assembly protein PilE
MSNPIVLPPRAPRGFTLIELMIVTVVVAILAAVALPSFFDSVRKSRRADAVAALAKVQQAQERWRANNTAYTTSLTDLKVDSASDDGYYAVAITSANAGGYVATATATGSQSSDTACGTFTITVTATDAAGNKTPNPCWSR